MLPNQYYPTMPNNNYMIPQYQNYQMQQPRQDNANFNYVRDRSEAEQWAIAPGSKLFFEDQNGSYLYIKSLGYGPNDRPVFISYKKEEIPIQQNIQQNNFDFTKYDNEMACVKNDISELKEMLKELTAKPNFNKFEKKGGGNK